MILKDDFFTIEQFSEENNQIFCRISLNPEHSIYQAHFPGNPVTPGVCIIQTTQELTSEYLQVPLFLERVVKSKFTNVINPTQYPEVDITMEIENADETLYKVTAKVAYEETTFAQLVLIFMKAK